MSNRKGKKTSAPKIEVTDSDAQNSNRKASELLHHAKNHIKRQRETQGYKKSSSPQPQEESPPLKPSPSQTQIPIAMEEPSVLEFQAPEVYLHQNRYGGIHVNKKDIETLFKFIDPTNYGRVKQGDLKKKISLFARELRGKDYKLLMTGKDELSISELHDILKNNELENFDPIAEAFKFFDPEGSGSVDMERLREIFLLLGYGDLSYADLNSILEIADTDGDHKISLDDFRKLIPTHEGSDDETNAKRRPGYTYSEAPEIHALFKKQIKSFLQ